MVLEVLERILEELARFYLNGHCAWVIARRANGYCGDSGVELMGGSIHDCESLIGVGDRIHSVFYHHEGILDAYGTQPIKDRLGLERKRHSHFKPLIIEAGRDEWLLVDLDPKAMANEACLRPGNAHESLSVTLLVREL